MSDYITLAEFKYTLEATQFQNFDQDAQAAITAASRGIDEYTGRFFYSSAGTRDYTPKRIGYSSIDIDDLPSSGTVKFDMNRDGSFITTWMEGVHYHLAPYNAPLLGKPYETVEMVPYSGAYIPWLWPKSLRVIGTFGWAAVPATIKEATTILATRLMRRSREAPFGVVGLGIDNVLVRVSRIDPDVAFLLDPFRKDQGAMAA